MICCGDVSTINQLFQHSTGTRSCRPINRPPCVLYSSAGCRQPPLKCQSAHANDVVTLLLYTATHASRMLARWLRALRDEGVSRAAYYYQPTPAAASAAVAPFLVGGSIDYTAARCGVYDNVSPTTAQHASVHLKSPAAV